MLLKHLLTFSFFISQKKNPSFMDVQCIYQRATLTLFYFLAESNLNLK